MNPMEAEKLALWWGPGVLLLMAFGYGFMRLARYWIEKSMEIKCRQMDSAFSFARQYVEQFLGTQQSQADALSRLASSVEQHESLESLEHREMLIAIKALHRDVSGLSHRDQCLCVGTHPVRPTSGATTPDVNKRDHPGRPEAAPTSSCGGPSL